MWVLPIRSFESTPSIHVNVVLRCIYNQHREKNSMLVILHMPLIHRLYYIKLQYILLYCMVSGFVLMWNGMVSQPLRWFKSFFSVSLLYSKSTCHSSITFTWVNKIKYNSINKKWYIKFFCFFTQFVEFLHLN